MQDSVALILHQILEQWGTDFVNSISVQDSPQKTYTQVQFCKGLAKEIRTSSNKTRLALLYKRKTQSHKEVGFCRRFFAVFKFIVCKYYSNDFCQFDATKEEGFYVISLKISRMSFCMAFVNREQ